MKYQRQIPHYNISQVEPKFAMTSKSQHHIILCKICLEARINQNQLQMASIIVIFTDSTSLKSTSLGTISTLYYTGAVYSNPKRVLGTARDARLRATSLQYYLLTVIEFRAG